MIVERNSGVTLSGNMTGEAYTAGINDENMGHIIGLFTDLYSDPEMAVVREYSTNAHDAHIAAGVTRPIEVRLPTALSPFFSVRDYGEGLDKDDIRTIYSRYGSSTKRATNDQVGALGLGCKSALTYAEQFTVESIKDGVRTVCSVSREDGGVPVFTVVGSFDAGNEPSGTKVTVPARTHNSFENKAATLFRHWTPGTVLVNDEQPTPLDGLRVSDDILICKHDGFVRSAGNIVVMGGVPYPVEDEHLRTELPPGYYAAITVPIGAVNFTPSREALMYTTTTKATLSSLPDKIRTALKTAVQREIESATTTQGAIRSMLKWRALLGTRVSPTEFRFKGSELPETLDGRFVLSSTGSRKLGQHETAPRGINVDYVGSALFITNYSPTNFTAQHKRKLLQWCQNKGIETVGQYQREVPDGAVQFFAMTDASSVDTRWVDPSRVASWDEIKKIVLPRNSNASVWRNGRPTGSYDAYIGGDFVHIQADEIDQNEAIYYCQGLNRRESNRYAQVIGDYDPSATVVCLPVNRADKFKRTFPEAQTYRQGLQEAYNAWKNGLGKDVRTAMAVAEAGGRDVLRKLDPARVDDPKIKAAIPFAKIDLQKVYQEQRAFRDVLHAVQVTTPEWDDPTEGYALLPNLLSGYSSAMRDPDFADHVYLYMNAVYAAQNAGKKAQAA